jgi:hypothetical protein
VVTDALMSCRDPRGYPHLPPTVRADGQSVALCIVSQLSDGSPENAAIRLLTQCDDRSSAESNGSFRVRPGGLR